MSCDTTDLAINVESSCFSYGVIVIGRRYRSVNVAFFRPCQLRDLYDGADVNEVVKQSEQKGRRYGN